MEGNSKLEIKDFSRNDFLFQIDEGVGKDVWELSYLFFFSFLFF
jgi:hypothetical protein